MVQNNHMSKNFVLTCKTINTIFHPTQHQICFRFFFLLSNNDVRLPYLLDDDSVSLNLAQFGTEFVGGIQKLLEEIFISRERAAPKLLSPPSGSVSNVMVVFIICCCCSGHATL